MDEMTTGELIDWIIQLSDTERLRALGALCYTVPQAVHEALTLIDAQTPPQ